MTIHQDVDLFALNTFAVHARAECLVECDTVEDLLHLREHEALAGRAIFMLGGGSNVLFNDRVEDAVVRFTKLGKTILEESSDSVLVRFEAGERWHDCVRWAVDNGFGGIENMALIPGSIGASPIQNIGAYGREFKDVAQAVHYVEFDSATITKLSAAQCAFGYRDSVFKRELKSKVAITAVELRLTKEAIVDTAYRDLERELHDRKIEKAGIRDVFDAIVAIRTRKLPDPLRLANAGSFFKNPMVAQALAESLKERHEDMPMFDTDLVGIKKIPAAWLIEKAGFKGLRRGAAGVYEHHALVMVNYGGATGSEIIALADEVIARVRDQFGIELEKEVNIVGIAEDIA